MALAAEEQEVESRGGRTTLAKTFFNIYQRTAFLKESRKVGRCHHSAGDDLIFSRLYADEDRCAYRRTGIF